MKTRGWRIIVLSILGTGALYGGSGTWENFTSMKDVKGLARSGHSYWAATSGGLFRWDEGRIPTSSSPMPKGFSAQTSPLSYRQERRRVGCASTG